MSLIWKGRPASPQGTPAPMTSWNINVSNGSVVLNDGTYELDAFLYFGLPDDVYFQGIQSFADFAIHPPNTIEPNVQIEAESSPPNLCSWTVVSDG